MHKLAKVSHVVMALITSVNATAPIQVKPLTIDDADADLSFRSHWLRRSFGLHASDGCLPFQRHSVAPVDELRGRRVELQSGRPGRRPRRVDQVVQRPRPGGHHCRQEGSRHRGQHEGEEAPRADGGHALRTKSGGAGRWRKMVLNGKYQRSGGWKDRTVCGKEILR